MIERLGRVFSSLPAARFPNIAALAPVLTTGDGDQRFRFSIDVFLDGLVARSAGG